MFYRHTALFKSQQVVDRLVDDIAFTFDLPRASLNVVRMPELSKHSVQGLMALQQAAAAKGLAAGAFRIISGDGANVENGDGQEVSLATVNSAR